MAEKIAQNQYKKAHDKESYYHIRLRVPKEKKAVVDELIETTGKSINRIFIEAVEKVYRVNLTLAEDEIWQYVDKKAATLKELGMKEQAVRFKKFYEEKKNEQLPVHEFLNQLEQKYGELLA